MCFQDHYIGMTQWELISGNAIFLTTPIEQKEKCEIQNFCIRDCSFYQLFSCDKPTFCHYEEAASPTWCLLLNLFMFKSEITGSIVTRLSPQARPSTSAELELVTFQFRFDVLLLFANLPNQSIRFTQNILLLDLNHWWWVNLWSKIIAIKPKPTEKSIFNVTNTNLLVECTKQFFMRTCL